MPHPTTSSAAAFAVSGRGGGQPVFRLPHPPRRTPLRAPAASGYAGGGVRTPTSHPQQPTLYELLGIPTEVTTTFEDVRAAYRRMARRYRPDVSPTPEAAVEHTRRFIQVQEAYETLSDPGPWPAASAGSLSTCPRATSSMYSQELAGREVRMTDIVGRPDHGAEEEEHGEGFRREPLLGSSDAEENG